MNSIIMISIFSSIFMWIYWVLLVKLNISGSIIYFVFTNKAVYVFSHPKRSLFSNKVEILEKIELSSLTAILLKKLEKKDFQPRGILDFIYPKHTPSKVKTYQINRTTIGEVNDIFTKYNIIESILWFYNGINERIYAIIRELDLGNPPEIRPTSQELIRLKKRIKNHNIEIIIGSMIIIISSILISSENNIVTLICIFGIIPSLTLIITLIRFDFMTRLILPSKEGNIQLTQEGIKFIYEKGTISLDFNSNMKINFKIIPIKANTKQIIFIGTITIQTINKPNLKIKFGPTIEIMQILELLYLYYISWKNKHQILLSKADILNLRDIKSAISSKELKKEKVNSSKITNVVQFQKLGLVEEKEDNVKKMLNLNEEVLLIYQPERKTYIILIYILFLIVGVILVCYSVWRIIELLLVNFFVMPFTFGMVLIIFPLYFMYNYVFINKMYIFTNQKLIVKDFKKYHEVLYKDISLILLNEGQKSDVININFKAEAGINLNANLESISLRVQKDSDLYEKIISYKRSFT